MYVTGFPAHSDCWICGKKIEESFWWDDRGKSHWDCDIARRKANEQKEAKLSETDEKPSAIVSE